MKKTTLLLAVLTMGLVLAGCGESSAPSAPAEPAAPAEIETEAEPVTEITYVESGEMETENYGEETGEVLEELSLDSSVSADGELLTVELNTDPASGYSWTYVIGDESLMEMKSEIFLEDDTAEGMVGEGRVQQLTFQSVAKAKGETSIYFFYLAPEEELDIPEGEDMDNYSDVTVDVKIAPNGSVSVGG